MKQFTLLLMVAALLVGGLFVYRQWIEPKKTISDDQPESAEVRSYWTCPMHPQIHSDHPGECPICHMKLVPVKAQGTPAAHLEESDRRSQVSASSYQLKLVGIQKVAVEKMDLMVQIPISGRLISPSKIAFQVYEGDLRYIRPGLSFSAVSSFIPDEGILGEITSMDSIADPTSRTIRVLGTIRKGPRGLISETTFSGQVEVPLKGIVAIPESSVLHAGSSDLVYLVQNDGSLRAKPVKLGQKTESYYEVREGLTPGEFISSGPNFLIDSEAKIRAASMPGSNGESKLPSCPTGQHWDIPMTMCMPGDK